MPDQSSAASQAGGGNADTTRVSAAYYEGKLVPFRPAPPKRKQHEFSIGPWRFGPALSAKRPLDRRGNLYLVAPGMQYRDARWPAFDLNVILSALPRTGDEVEWDVYWAIVLDPSLVAHQESSSGSATVLPAAGTDFRGERELLITAQAVFAPGDKFTFSDIPGKSFLREFLNISDMDSLAAVRRPDGTLPRLIIVPAGFMVRASAVDPDAPPPKSAWQRALDRLSRRRTTAAPPAGGPP